MDLPPHLDTVCAFEDDTAAVAFNRMKQGGQRPEYPGSGAAMLSAGFRWTVLERHGVRPLAVLGRLLLQANNRCSGLPCWSEITIHETAAGRFTASVRHQPPETFGAVWKNTWLCETPEAIAATLYDHDATRALPPHLTTRRPSAVVPGDMTAFDDAVYRDAAAALRFRGAWAGLLATFFGMPTIRQSAK